MHDADRSDLCAISQAGKFLHCFPASDPMEWVHCHIARRPVAPDRYTKEIPELLSAIVMKLLAKTAEERYQTAAGDLRRCLTAWEAHCRIDPFQLGAQFRRRLLPSFLEPFAVIRPDSWDSRLYQSAETIYLLRSPFPGLPTRVRCCRNRCKRGKYDGRIPPVSKSKYLISRGGY